MKTAGKNKKSPQPTGNWLRGNWKHSENSRKKLKFSLKNCKIGRQGREDSPQSARQKSPTALKRLDISIKCASKMARRFCCFCTIQQRKKPMTSFLSWAYGADEGIWTHTLLRELEPESSASASSATSAYSVGRRVPATCIIIAAGGANVKHFCRKISLSYSFIIVTKVWKPWTWPKSTKSKCWQQRK